MNEQAKAARRDYKRKWAKQNPEKVKAQQERYWTKKAAEAAEQEPAQLNPLQCPQSNHGGAAALIFEILSEGAENARTGKEICKLLNITARDLTAAIERERRAGKPICASTGSNPGYFLAANQEEMQRYCKSLLHRAGEIHKTRQACIKAMEDLPV